MGLRARARDNCLDEMASHHDVVRRVMCIKSKLSSDPLPDREKITKLLQKLTRLPVDVAVLQETGIGKCVNELKKEYPGMAEYVKPLIQSWKSLVRSAMQQEAGQQQNNPSRDENSEISEDTDGNTEGRTHSTPSHPRLIIPERGHGEQQYDGDGENDKESDSSADRTANDRGKVRRRKSSDRNVPPTPVPWSPGQKVFPPYVPRKERSSESSDGQEKCNGPSIDTTGNRNNQSLSSESQLQSSGNQSHGSRPLSEDRNSPHRSTHKTSHSVKSSSMKESQSGRSEKRISASSNSVTGTNKVSRTEPNSKVNPSSQSHSNAKKRPSKSVPLEDDSSMLFQPDVAKVRTKTSPEGDKQQKIKCEKVDHKLKEDSPHVTSEQKSSKPEPSGHSRNETRPPKSHRDDSTNKSRDKKVASSEKLSSHKCHKLTSVLSKGEDDSKEKMKMKSSKVLKSTREDNPSKKVKTASDSGETVGDVGESFETTGMSFGDCLFGTDPSVPKRAKVAHPNKVKKTAKHDSKNTKDGRSTGSKDGPRSSEKRRHGEGQSADKPKKRKSASAGDKTTKPMKKKPKPEDDSMREASASEVEMSLPDIRPDYKPTPKLPELKLQEKRRDPLDMQYLGSKQTKTKVYSGKARKTHYDSLPSLQEICKEVIFDNIHALDETNVPFFLMEDILEKCTPQQLLRIEDYNPEYILESNHLWKKHTTRFFGGSKPEEMESWRELYLRKNDEREYKLLSITANISAGMAKKETGRLTKMAFVDKPVKPPRNVLRQQMRHGTARSSTPAKAPQPRKAVPVVHSEQTSHRIIPEREAVSVSPVKKRGAKMVAPMMRKSMKMMKKVNSRR